MDTQSTTRMRTIGRRGIVTAAIAVAAALALPALASAKTIHFTGKATGTGADTNMTIGFDLGVSKGRPVSISNVEVANADYACANGADGTDRGFRFFDPGAVTKKGKMTLDAPALPPGFHNHLEGSFTFPKAPKKAKKGAKRPAPTVKGWVSSEFGYDPENFDRFNCIAVESFVATPGG